MTAVVERMSIHFHVSMFSCFHTSATFVVRPKKKYCKTILHRISKMYIRNWKLLDGSYSIFGQNSQKKPQDKFMIFLGRTSRSFCSFPPPHTQFVVFYMTSTSTKNMWRLVLCVCVLLQLFVPKSLYGSLYNSTVCCLLQLGAIIDQNFFLV